MRIAVSLRGNERRYAPTERQCGSNGHSVIYMHLLDGLGHHSQLLNTVGEFVTPFRYAEHSNVNGSWRTRSHRDIAARNHSRNGLSSARISRGPGTPRIGLVRRSVEAAPRSSADFCAGVDGNAEQVPCHAALELAGNVLRGFTGYRCQQFVMNWQAAELQ